MVEWLFFAVPLSCLPFVIVVFPDHTHLLFWSDSLAVSIVVIIPRFVPFPRFLSLKIKAIITAIKVNITAPNTPDTVPSATVRPGNVKNHLQTMLHSRTFK